MKCGISSSLLSQIAPKNYQNKCQKENQTEHFETLDENI